MHMYRMNWFCNFWYIIRGPKRFHKRVYNENSMRCKKKDFGSFPAGGLKHLNPTWPGTAFRSIWSDLSSLVDMTLGGQSKTYIRSTLQIIVHWCLKSDLLISGVNWNRGPAPFWWLYCFGPLFTITLLSKHFRCWIYSCFKHGKNVCQIL